MGLDDWNLNLPSLSSQQSSRAAPPWSRDPGQLSLPPHLLEPPCLLETPFLLEPLFSQVPSFPSLLPHVISAPPHSPQFLLRPPQISLHTPQAAHVHSPPVHPSFQSHRSFHRVRSSPIVSRSLSLHPPFPPAPLLVPSPPPLQPLSSLWPVPSLWL